MSQNLLQHTLSVESLSTTTDTEPLADALSQVPGLEEVDVDPATGEVEVAVDSEVAVGDARWVLRHRGHELA
ncbi:hypothetical protein [Haloparvum sp. PAK95]|uniref:hypothetical protein n=1 Tax=Haloparvum sp. PAK95 TaxID=3418962 RepID=UPI003D2F368C